MQIAQNSTWAEKNIERLIKFLFLILVCGRTLGRPAVPVCTGVPRNKAHLEAQSESIHACVELVHRLHPNHRIHFRATT